MCWYWLPYSNHFVLRYMIEKWDFSFLVVLITVIKSSQVFHIGHKFFSLIVKKNESCWAYGIWNFNLLYISTSSIILIKKDLLSGTYFLWIFSFILSWFFAFVLSSVIVTCYYIGYLYSICTLTELLHNTRSGLPSKWCHHIFYCFKTCGFYLLLLGFLDPFIDFIAGLIHFK